MSRLGNKPIDIPQGVQVTISPDMAVNVKGPKGQMGLSTEQRVSLEQEENSLWVRRPDDSKQSRAYHGLYVRLIRNLMIGVTEGFKKELVLEGVGYRAAKSGKGITLSIGYSHPVEFPAPEGITLDVPDQNQVVISGMDKQQVGQVAADIRALREPEPYKGKGIRYKDEHIRRKEGKTGA